MGIGKTTAQHSAEFIDRTKELALLKERVDAAAAGKGSLTFVEGEAGVGKTRIVAEAGRHASAKGFKFLTGRCIAQQDVDPYLPFFEALRGYVRPPASQVDDELDYGSVPLGLAGMARSGGRMAPDNVEGGIPIGLSMLAERTGTGMGVQAERDRMFDTFNQILVRIADESPVLLFIDDLQWADSGSLQLLHYVTRNTRNSRVMICCAYRPEELRDVPGGSHPLLDMQRKMSKERLYETMTLARLGNDDMSALVKSILGIEDIPQHFLRKLYDESEGNPFFVEEVLHSLIEEGVIKPDSYVWDAGVDLSTIRIPSTIKDVTARRIARMDDNTRKVLMYAAVIGTQFNFDVLHKVTEMDSETLLDSLDKLMAVGIIREDRSTSDEIYVFDHKQTASSMYEGQSKSRARLMHKKVGEAMELVYTGRLEEVVYSLARHFYLGKDGAKTFKYSVAAGDKAKKLLALEEALDYYATALKLLSQLEPSSAIDKPAESIRLAIACGDLCYDLGNPYAAMPHFRQAIDAARSKGDRQMMSASLRKLADMHKQRAEYSDSERLYSEALVICQQTGDTAGVADIERGFGYIHWRRGQVDDAIQHYNQSIAHSTKIGDKHAIARVNIDLGNVYNQRSEQEKAVGYYTMSIKDLDEIGDHVEIMRAYNNLGDSYLHTRNWDKAIEAFEKCRLTSEKLGNRNFIAWSLFNAAEALAMKGELERAEEYCARSLKICESTDDKIGMNGVFKNFGIIYRLKKEWDRSIENLNKGIVIMEMLNIPYDLALSYYELGLTYKAMGDAACALQNFMMALDHYKAIGSLGEAKLAEEHIEELKRQARA
ncbi:MAG: tetratricopeptide repeat protein [Euryarchaeota archaeon]|nr:tetratricopeptide repeat protein [Euryarchaeota archaeon]